MKRRTSRFAASFYFLSLSLLGVIFSYFRVNTAIYGGKYVLTYRERRDNISNQKGRKRIRGGKRHGGE
jgi:hypothetical protein